MRKIFVFPAFLILTVCLVFLLEKYLAAAKMKSMPGGVSEVSGAENRQEFQAIAQYTVDKLNSDKVRFRH